MALPMTMSLQNPTHARRPMTDGAVEIAAERLSPALLRRPAVRPALTVSLVSHGHGGMLATLLADLASYAETSIEVLLTLNIPEPLPTGLNALPFPVRVQRNEQPLGFGENHNRAAALATADAFCVLNPDVAFSADPFAPMLAALRDPTVGVVGPAVYGSQGEPQDHARRFPTVSSLVKKAITGERPIEYDVKSEPIEPDWISGLCMAFRTQTFRKLGGFDTKYFLYYEDVDLCARARAAGLRIVVDPASRLVHDGCRRSWRNPYYTAMHLKSMARFFGADPRRPREPLDTPQRVAHTARLDDARA